MSILERKAEIINNYFYKDMGNISNRKIWNTLKDIHTHKDLNLFELKVNDLIRETNANKSWADIYTEAKATVFIRKLGIEIKGHKYEVEIFEDEYNKNLVDAHGFEKLNEGTK
tara:strand:+ start:223 stop:561 length:339 start_codon:yes stop_codon:yes gene_type:complete